MTRRLVLKYLVVSGLLLAVAGAAAAGEPATPQPLKLTLAEALEQARATSPRLDELRSLVEARQAARRGASAARLPEVGVSATYQRQSHVPELAIPQPDGSRRVIFPDLPNRYSGEVGLSMPLYTGGALAWGDAAAASRTRAARSDLESAGSALELEVTSTYLELALARRRERVLAKGIEAFEAHLHDVENLQRFGMAAANDVLAVKVQRDRAELARLRAANAAAVAESDLGRLLGSPLGQRLEVVEPAAAKPAEDSGDLAQLLETALAHRPEVAALQARIDAAAAATRVKEAALRPRVSADARWDYARPNPAVLPLTDSFQDFWNVSLRVGWTVFDGGRRRAQVQSARAEADALRHRLEALTRDVRQEVTARVGDLDTATAALTVTATNLEAARESRRVAADRYREGLIPSSDLLDAEVAELQAGLDRTAAAVDVHLARARLDRALGR